MKQRGATTRLPDRETLQDLFWWGLIAANVVVSLYPLLQSGYYSDDMVRSLIRPLMELRGESFLAYFLRVNTRIIGTAGRLYPVNLFLTNLVYYCSGTAGAYKTVILLLVLLNIFSFGYFVKIMTGNKKLAYLCMLVMPLFFQFRLYHDPILSFGGLMQIFFLLLIVSLICLKQYLRGYSYWYWSLSVVLYNACLYSYELSFLLLPAYFLLIFGAGRRFRESATIATPFLLSALIAAALNLLALFVWKDPLSAGYAGTKLGLISSVLKTFFIQSSATLPLSYYFGNPSKFFDPDLSALLSQVSLLPGLFAVVVTFAMFHLTTNLDMRSITGRAFSLTGLIFLVLPALFVALSEKYQQDLIRYGFGMAYIQVYIQYYGLVMLSAGGIFFLLRLLSRGRQAAVLIVLILLNGAMLVNLQNNAAVVEKANIDLYYRRRALEEALQKGLLQKVPEHSSILIVDNYTYDPYPKHIVSALKGWAKGGYPWKSAALLYQHSGKRMSVYSQVSGLLDKADIQPGVSDYRLKNAYMLTICSYPPELHKKEGYVVLQKIRSITINQADRDNSRIELDDADPAAPDKGKT